MAATSAADGSTWSSMTSTPTTRGRSPPAPAYSGNPTTTATATADTVPATSRETSGASAPAQFHSTGAGRPPGDAAHQIDPICMTQLMSAGGILLARADITCRGRPQALPPSATKRSPGKTGARRVIPGYSRLALVGAQQGYHVIGNLPSGAACSLAAGNTILTGLSPASSVRLKVRHGELTAQAGATPGIPPGSLPGLSTGSGPRPLFVILHSCPTGRSVRIRPVRHFGDPLVHVGGQVVVARGAGGLPHPVVFRDPHAGAACQLRIRRGPDHRLRGFLR